MKNHVSQTEKNMLCRYLYGILQIILVISKPSTSNRRNDCGPVAISTTKLEKLIKNITLVARVDIQCLKRIYLQAKANKGKKWLAF